MRTPCDGAPINWGLKDNAAILSELDLEKPFLLSTLAALLRQESKEKSSPSRSGS